MEPNSTTIDANIANIANIATNTINTTNIVKPVITMDSTNKPAKKSNSLVIIARVIINGINNKYTNTIVKTNTITKIKQDTLMSCNSNNKDKKTDIIIPSTDKSGGVSSSRKKCVASSLPSNSKSKNCNGNGINSSKNIKLTKIEEEFCHDNKSYDSSELSEEDYTY